VADMTINPDGTSTPRPDPTLLTTEALLREVSQLEKTINLQLVAAAERTAGERRLSEEKFDGYKNQLSALTKMLDERYATQTKALDAAFLTQQTAMQTALNAAEKAVNAALIAAKEAVDKANTANEKRFESVNEFRGQLNDLVGTMISRNEAGVRFQAIEEKISNVQSAIDKGFTAVDVKGMAGQQYWGYLVGAVGLIAVIITLFLALTR